jgi:hypothetical protein
MSNQDSRHSDRSNSIKLRIIGLAPPCWYLREIAILTIDKLSLRCEPTHQMVLNELLGGVNRRHDPPILRSEVPHVLLGIAWMVQRLLRDLRLEIIDRIIEEGGEEESASRSNVTPENCQKRIGVSRVQMGKDGKKPDDVEGAFDWQVGFRSHFHASGIIPAVLHGPVGVRETWIVNLARKVLDKRKVDVDSGVALDGNMAVDYRLGETHSAPDVENIAIRQIV